jgi:hypothetical protein
LIQINVEQNNSVQHFQENAVELGRQSMNLIARLIPAAAAALLASCAATDTTPSRYSYSIQLPQDCEATNVSPGRGECGFSKGGRKLGVAQTVTTKQFGVPDAESRALAGDSAYWQKLVVSMEMGALSRTSYQEAGSKVVRKEILGQPGPIIPGSRACVRYRYDLEIQQAFVDNEGISCLFFDPSNKVRDMIVVEYLEFRVDRPRAPGFSAEAKQVALSLKQNPQ